MSAQYRSLIALVAISTVVTGVNVWLTYQVELVLLPATTLRTWMLLIGFIEEAFVRLLPLIVVFYFWSYQQGQLLSKSEGILATVASGTTVGTLELIFKLEYLSRLEATARLDSMVLPILLVHLPFALVAGRFVYALGERIHGPDTIGLPSLSRRDLLLLFAGYLTLAIAHVIYNLLI